jgi:hypothetical protein
LATLTGTPAPDSSQAMLFQLMAATISPEASAWAIDVMSLL